MEDQLGLFPDAVARGPSEDRSQQAQSAWLLRKNDIAVACLLEDGRLWVHSGDAFDIWAMDSHSHALAPIIWDTLGDRLEL